MLSPKCRAIIPLSKEYFPVPQVEPFGYDKAPNEGTVKFWAKFGGNFPIFPKIGGRGEESNHGKRIPQIYSVVSKERTVTSGDNSWFSKFHDISSGTRKCGALKNCHNQR